MATNLLSSGKIDLSKYPIPNCYGWSDSITVLYSSCKIIIMHIGSRACKRIDIKNSWTNGTSCLSDRENWPKKKTIQAPQISVNEENTVKKIFKIAVSLKNNIQYQLLERFNLTKTLRILSWVQLFTITCNVTERKKGSKEPVTTKEIDL